MTLEPEEEALAAQTDSLTGTDGEKSPDEQSAGGSLRDMSPRYRNLMLALVAVALLGFAWYVRSVLNPLIAAYFLAFVLHPLVLQLQNYGWSRKRAVNTIFVTAILLLGSVGLGIGGQALHYSQTVSNEGWRDEQIAKVDSFLERHEARVKEVRDLIGYPVPEGGSVGIRGMYDDAKKAISERSAKPTDPTEAKPSRRMDAALALFGSLLAFVGFIVLLPIYTYFLLFELEGIHSFVRRYIPRSLRERVSNVGGQIGEVIGSFFRGRLTICLAKGLFIAAGLGVCGIDYALLLGMGAGVLSLIPFVGPLLSFFAAFVLALQQPASASKEGFDLLAAAWRTGLVFGLAEIFEGYYLTPKILGESLGLHPVVVLVSIFAGGAAFGMFGILLALPVTAALVILFRVFVLPAMERLADE